MTRKYLVNEVRVVLVGWLSRVVNNATNENEQLAYLPSSAARKIAGRLYSAAREIVWTAVGPTLRLLGPSALEVVLLIVATIATVNLKVKSAVMHCIRSAHVKYSTSGRQRAHECLVQVSHDAGIAAHWFMESS